MSWIWMALEIEKKDPYKNRNNRTDQANINMYVGIKHTSYWPLFKQSHKKKKSSRNCKKKNPITNVFKFVYYYSHTIMKNINWHFWLKLIKVAFFFSICSQIINNSPNSFWYIYLWCNSFTWSLNIKVMNEG